MILKVFYSAVRCIELTKKNQQRCLMILESKNIPFQTIDITDPSQDEARIYMTENAQPKGDNKVPATPQIFNEATYCGDFEDLDSANECDEIGEFLKLTSDELKGVKIGITGILPKSASDEVAPSEPTETPLTNGMSTNNQEDVQEQPISNLEKDPQTVSHTKHEGETTEDPSVGAPEITSNEDAN
ncbi:unnamed protein product, partial [Meganyctiphanes norvegica]